MSQQPISEEIPHEHGRFAVAEYQRLIEMGYFVGNEKIELTAYSIGESIPLVLSGKACGSLSVADVFEAI